jgi:hypothetical protein
LTYRYLAKVDRVGDRWRGSIRGLPVEVLMPRLDQMTYRMGQALAAYLGVEPETLTIDYDMPGRAPSKRRPDVRRLATIAQLLGAGVVLAGLLMLLGIGWTLLALGAVTVAVATLTEMNGLPRRKPVGTAPRTPSAVI